MFLFLGLVFRPVFYFHYSSRFHLNIVYLVYSYKHPFPFISHDFLINVYLNCKFILTILYLFCILSSLLFSTVAVSFFAFRLLFSLPLLHDSMLSVSTTYARLSSPTSPTFHCSPLTPLGNSSLPLSPSRLCLLILFLSLVLCRAGRVYI